jgi:DNA-binding winged helix-turn-helix (wHTH) protein/TolB-like protein
MVRATQLHHGFWLGDWLVEPLKGSISSADGQLHHLQPKVMDVLVCLATNCGEPLDRQNLLNCVWGKIVVSDESLTRTIGELRKVLGDDHTDPVYIETIPKRGYRLVGPVILVEPSPVAEKPLMKPRTPLRALYLGASILGLASVLFLSRQPLLELFDPPVAAETGAIAVMPFVACGTRPDDADFADSLTWSVRSRLSRHEDLKLIGRISTETVARFSHSPAETADHLRAAYILFGEACRDGESLTLRAELTDSSGIVVWEQEFNQAIDSGGSVEPPLATAVANHVTATLGVPEGSAIDAAVDRHALELFLIAEEQLHQRDFDQARATLQKALEIQPDYPEALWTLAVLEIQSHWSPENQMGALELAMPILARALVAANAVLLRNPRSFDANFVAGQIVHSVGTYENELAYRRFHEIGPEQTAAARQRAEECFLQAAAYFRAALSIDPSASDARIMLANSLAFGGVTSRREALDVLLSGLELDPFNEELNRELAFRLDDFGRLREAIELIDRFDYLPPGKGQLWWTKLELLQLHKRYDEKLGLHIEILKEAGEFALTGSHVYHLWWMVSDIASLGLIDEAERLYSIVAQIPDPANTGPWWRHHFLESLYAESSGRYLEVARQKVSDLVDKTDEELLEAWQPEVMQNARALWITGNKGRAIRLVEAVQHYPPPPDKWPHRVADTKIWLAMWYKQVGRDADALQVLQDAVSRLSPEYEGGHRHPQFLMQYARAEGMLGNTDRAIELLDLAIDYGGYDLAICCEDFVSATRDQRHNKKFWSDSLQEDPRFVVATARMHALVEQQRSNIRALLVQNDFERLVAPLIEP